MCRPAECKQHKNWRDGSKGRLRSLRIKLNWQKLRTEGLASSDLKVPIITSAILPSTYGIR